MLNYDRYRRERHSKTPIDLIPRLSRDSSIKVGFSSWGGIPEEHLLSKNELFHGRKTGDW